MGALHIGCQTYTWEMLGDKWNGTVDDILDIIAGAGYEGVEITNTMIGNYYESPDLFANALQKRGLILAAFGIVPLHGWTKSHNKKEEFQNAVKGVHFVSHFPGCRLNLAGGSSSNRKDLDEKFDTMCHMYREIADYAVKKDIWVDVHPHSHAGSIIETSEEYERLMMCTDPKIIGWCPDTGHILRGGLDLLPTLRKYQERIRHIHFKDVDAEGVWQMMGKGICDFKETLQLLEDIGYSGWVIGEEESDEARIDQKDAVVGNRKYLKTAGY